jgi:hypothetical protein
MIFKADPTAALDKARKKLSSVDENLASLRAKRAEVLLTSDDAGAVVAIDQAIEAEQRNAEIYKDRIKALQEELRRHAFEGREDQRKAAIKKLSAHLAKRADVAAKLEAAITEVGDLFDRLVAPDYAADVWPFPSPPFADFDRAPVAKEIGWAMHGLVSGHGLPMPSSVGLGVHGVRAAGIAATVRNQNQGILARAESAPIHDDLLAETA